MVAPTGFACPLHCHMQCAVAMSLHWRRELTSDAFAGLCAFRMLSWVRHCPCSTATHVSRPTSTPVIISVKTRVNHPHALSQASASLPALHNAQRVSQLSCWQASAMQNGHLLHNHRDDEEGHLGCLANLAWLEACIAGAIATSREASPTIITQMSQNRASNSGT